MLPALAPFSLCAHWVLTEVSQVGQGGFPFTEATLNPLSSQCPRDYANPFPQGSFSSLQTQPTCLEGKSDSMVSSFQDSKWSPFVFIAHQAYSFYIRVSMLWDLEAPPGCCAWVYATATAWLHSCGLSMVVFIHKGQPDTKNQSGGVT